jgi:hypothetical protein
MTTALALIWRLPLAFNPQSWCASAVALALALALGELSAHQAVA